MSYLVSLCILPCENPDDRQNNDGRKNPSQKFPVRAAFGQQRRFTATLSGCPAHIKPMVIAE
jgi:hypothetical protein